MIKTIRSSFLVLLPIALVACSSFQQIKPDGKISRGSGAYQQAGKASFYAMKYQSRPTASGELFNQNAMTAAHKTLPFGTRVNVINTKNGRSVVRINDRGPFVKGRIIDLSRSAFASIASTRLGVIHVAIEVVTRSN